MSLRRARGRTTIFKAVVADESGAIPAVWFNQPWLEDKLRPGTRVRLRGQLRRNEFKVKSYDLNGASATADLAPIYPAGEEITPPRMRALADRALELVPNEPDPLPAELKLARGAAPARGRAARAPPAADARGGGGGAAAARVRRAAPAPARPRAAHARARAGGGAGARRARRAARAAIARRCRSR